MIYNIARSLAAALPECTAEEIADVLWLVSALTGQPDGAMGFLSRTSDKPSGTPSPAPEGTEQPRAEQRRVMLARGGSESSGGRMVPATAVGFRAPFAMNRPLPTLRVLSLFRRIHRPGPLEVDIDATVEATADARRLVVVTRAGRERGLDVALVADTSPVMTVYARALTEFEAVLLRAGAFRTVNRWTLVPGSEVLIRDRAGIEHHPDRLIDPSGRRLVLLVTDATADHWYDSATWQALRRWADAMPTAIIHVLPEQYRSQGPLGSSAIMMRSRRPGAPNQAADVEVAWWDTDPPAFDAVPIPVVELHTSALAEWVQAVTAGTAWVNAVWARSPESVTAREANAEVSAEDRVRAFQATASRGAQSLARLLAGAPVLSWPLVGVLQARLLPGTGPSELAEVLVGGLLERSTNSVEENEGGQFRFRSVVSELLRRGTTATEEWDTFEVISEYLERNAGAGNGILALLADPQGVASVDAEFEPFAALGRSMAARLGLVPVDSNSTTISANVVGEVNPIEPPAPMRDISDSSLKADSGPEEPGVAPTQDIKANSATGNWIAAVHNNEDDLEPIGAAVVIDTDRVLTCAHVVIDSAGATLERLWVHFPQADEAPPRRVAAVAVAYSPPVRDIAVLVLEEPIPPGVDVAPLRTPKPSDLVGRPWWAFGFPGHDPLGSSADGIVGAELSYGWIRLDSQSRYLLRPGFAGAGLWSQDYEAVVGIVAQAHEGGDGRAISLHQVDLIFPDQKLAELAAWSARSAGQAALGQWGWTLGRDPEGIRHWRPRARGVSTDSERGYRFRGRTAALTRIVQWLDRPVPDERVLVVTGSPGTGKSAVLGRIITTADAAIRASLPPADRAVRATLGSVSCAIHARGKTALEVAIEVARAASARLPDEAQNLASVIHDALSDRRGERFNIIIDALDEADSTEQVRATISQIVLPLAMTCSSVGVQVVVGTRRRDSSGDLISQLGGALAVIDLDDPSYFAQEELGRIRVVLPPIGR